MNTIKKIQLVLFFKNTLSPSEGLGLAEKIKLKLNTSEIIDYSNNEKVEGLDYSNATIYSINALDKDILVNVSFKSIEFFLDIKEDNLSHEDFLKSIEASIFNEVISIAVNELTFVSIGIVMQKFYLENIKNFMTSNLSLKYSNENLSGLSLRVTELRDVASLECNYNRVYTSGNIKGKAAFQEIVDINKKDNNVDQPEIQKDAIFYFIKSSLILARQ